MYVKLTSAILHSALLLPPPSSGIILISSEEGETEENNPKTLKEMNVIDETILAVEDFLQDFKIKLIVYHR